jgi:anti-sigma regulatory factor (Ser/Thr protein kinase)
MSRAPSVTLRLDPRPIAAAEARLAVRDACQHLPAATLSDATLLVSELVTNAVIHAGGMITVVIDCDDDSVAIAVGDQSSAEPFVCDPDAADPCGRGMRLVNSIATRWGCNPSSDGEGKTVWFSLPT